MIRRHRERGAALLLAMLTVTIVATLAGARALGRSDIGRIAMGAQPPRQAFGVARQHHGIHVAGGQHHGRPCAWHA